MLDWQHIASHFAVDPAILISAVDLSYNQARKALGLTAPVLPQVHPTIRKSSLPTSRPTLKNHTPIRPANNRSLPGDNFTGRLIAPSMPLPTSTTRDDLAWQRYDQQEELRGQEDGVNESSSIFPHASDQIHAPVSDRTQQQNSIIMSPSLFDTVTNETVRTTHPTLRNCLASTYWNPGQYIRSDNVMGDSLNPSTGMMEQTPLLSFESINCDNTQARYELANHLAASGNTMALPLPEQHNGNAIPTNDIASLTFDDATTDSFVSNLVLNSLQSNYPT